MDTSRRTFLATTGLAGLVPAGALPALRRRAADPFTLGVASGDPAPDGFVIWTRLAPRPLAADGHGGMGSADTDVEWQVAEDRAFARVVRSGRVRARHASAHSVHVEVTGLRPGAEYFYRFRAQGHLSPAGRSLTTPAPGAAPSMTFAAASCAYYEHGYFTAYRRMAEQHPDLIVHLGDYFYEDSAGDKPQAQPIIRRHVGGKCASLADYRLRHAQYKTDPDLQAAHAAAPWAVTWDDHEVENNWAGTTPGTKVPGFPARKKAAIRAYYEHMPLRASALRPNGELRLTRQVTWGDLAAFHILDTRQYRDDQPCEDGVRVGCDARLDARRVLLGAGQLRWLDAGLRGSRARWNVLAQQIFLAQRDHRLGPGAEMALDGWDGYTAERDRVLRGLAATRNPVVLTGDVHVAHANELRTDFDDPGSPRAGVELVATSISSDGDGYSDPVGGQLVRAENPHVTFIDQRRGYIFCRAAPDALRAEFRTVPYITRRGAPAATAATFTVPDGARTFDPR
ncbi:alkaline phosphatase D family protein [Spirillospora sp. CA-294931]|uniref:alkaline phosphatase D family protein n=1 Tax=Spirillospora sp. CA-294931 TaxID=3240042 RepID=UPI003D8DCC42